MRLNLIPFAVLLVASCGQQTKQELAQQTEQIAAPEPTVGAVPTPAVKTEALDPDSAEAAVDVLRRYYGLISDGKYRDAWALWGHQGQDSGMTADAFAASFEKYTSYDATVGVPGEVDAGMMQRWVEIPVKITGKLKDGSGFVMEGPVVLHHIARDMEEVPADDKEWRIRDSSGVKPHPAG